MNYRNRQPAHRPPPPVQIHRHQPPPGMHPVLKAALVMLPFYLAVEWFGILVLDLPVIVLEILLAFLYLLSGLLAARFYGYRPRANPLNRRYDPTVQYGAGAGATLWVMAWVFFVLVMLLDNSQHVQLWVSSGLALVTFGFVDFLLALSLGAAGAKLGRR